MADRHQQTRRQGGRRGGEQFRHQPGQPGSKQGEAQGQAEGADRGIRHGAAPRISGCRNHGRTGPWPARDPFTLGAHSLLAEDAPSVVMRDAVPGSPMMDVQDLIHSYGDLTYGVVFLWTLIEGETIVLLAGIAARQGMLSLPALVLCAWTGTFLCDQIGFALGRRCGHRVIGRYPRLRAGVERALALLESHSTGFIFAFRFIYGVRNVSSLAMGMS